MIQIKMASDHNYQGCIKCQMHNIFNSGKKPGTQELCQLPNQWVETTTDLAGIWGPECMKAREEQEKWQLLDKRVETKS